MWICPHPNGHIQAIGTDDAGRRQYIYHEAWTESRSAAKHARVAQLARRLPAARVRLARDLRRRGCRKERVVALALTLLDDGLFRTGGEEYARDNGSYGVSTLLRSHVRVRRRRGRVPLPRQVLPAAGGDGRGPARRLRRARAQAGSAETRRTGCSATTTPTAGTTSPEPTSTTPSGRSSATTTASRTCGPGRRPSSPPSASRHTTTLRAATASAPDASGRRAPPSPSSSATPRPSPGAPTSTRPSSTPTSAAGRSDPRSGAPSAHGTEPASRRAASRESPTRAPWSGRCCGC